MSIIFILETLLYYFCLLTVSVKLFNGSTNKLKVISSFLLYIPLFVTSIYVPIEIFAIYNIVFQFVELIVLKLIVRNIKFGNLIYFYIIIFCLNIIVTSAIVTALSANTNEEVVIEIIVHCFMVASCTLICFTKFREKIQNTIFLTTWKIKLLILLLVMFSMLCIVLVIDSDFYSYDESWKSTLQNILVVLIILVCTTFPVLVVISTNNSYLKNLTANYENQLAAQAEHYSALSKANFELRRFRHDLTNIKIGVVQLINEGKHTEAISMLDSANTDIYSTTNSLLKFDTGNGIVDALLADKQQKAASSNIKIVFEGAVVTENITATELCVIFGNTIDNAIEACKKIDIEIEKIINIICKCNSGFLFLNMSNPVREPIIIKNNLPATTKDEKSLHGFGLYSLDKVIKKHHGELNLSCSDSTFCLDLSVCL